MLKCLPRSEPEKIISNLADKGLSRCPDAIAMIAIGYLVAIY